MLYHVLHIVTRWPHYNRYFFNYAVGIFALKWGDHRRDAQLYSGLPTGYTPNTFPYTFQAIDPTNNANFFNYRLNSAQQLSLMRNGGLQDVHHPLDPHELYYKEMKA